MNTDTVKNDWSETKGKLKSRFGKLSDENIESLKGSLDQLSSKLQSAYGYAKEQAEKECQSFKATLHGSNESDKKPGQESEKNLSPSDPKSPEGSDSKKVA